VGSGMQRGARAGNKMIRLIRASTVNIQRGREHMQNGMEEREREWSRVRSASAWGEVGHRLRTQLLGPLIVAVRAALR